MIKYNVATYNLIYIYSIPDEAHKGLLKIGKTSFSSSLSIAQLTPNCPTLDKYAHLRIDQQTKTAMVPYKLEYTELATRQITMKDGSTQIQSFIDDDVRDVLLNSNIHSIKFLESGKPSEWYIVDLDKAISAISCVKQGKLFLDNTVLSPIPTKPNINLRDEQEENIKYTMDIFKRYDTMLWDCKMRYGKTVTAYELIKRSGYNKVIVITHRPAVEDGWGSDHQLIFNGTNNKFIDKTNGSYSFDDAIDAENDAILKKTINDNIPFVYFASIQDLRGSIRVGGKYNKNNAVFDIDWDLLIIDEAHEGVMTDLGDAVIKAIRKPNTKVLSLSGTPYNIMSDYAENKFTWTYVDEQKAKEEWYDLHPDEKNPYEDLPKMNIYTFDLAEILPDSYRYVSDDSAFNFREFFRTWTGDILRDYRSIPSGKSIGDFVHEEDVFSFLTLISKEDAESNYPFSCNEYREMFSHTFWIVPGVKEAKALSAMIQSHPNFKDYEVVNIAGDGDEEKPYDEALALVKSSIKAFDKTITISCGKLTTGVTVREWTGIMMLSGSSSTSASGYMQAIFRVQSPGYINGKQKQNCYVFDFAPDRTLKVIAEVHRVTTKSIKSDDNAKRALGEFINFCPVISIEGNRLRKYNVDEMMRQIKRISVEAAVNSGFDDDSIYKSDAGITLDSYDENILRKLANVVIPQKKKRNTNEVIVSFNGLTEEKRKMAEKAQRKPQKDLTPEEKEALELLKKQKEEQKKLFNLLRAVSIRLPLLFYGADADITKIIHLRDFVNIVDEESWKEFMPDGLTTDLFLDILKYYDEDVVVGAGLRIRKLAKQADELPPTLRAKRIVEILSRFKNPDKETVLTPWNVVNMHLGEVFGGYVFFDDTYKKELDEPRFVEVEHISTDVFLNPKVKILEMNSKSGLYPLFMAYTLYMIRLTGKEKNASLEETNDIWFDVLKNNIYVLCKTKMAKMITIRTLVGYTNKTVNAVYLTKLIEERMKDLERLSRKLTNPETWGQGGDRMKFDAVIGNPPYQNGNQQIYVYFYLSAINISNKYVSLIFPMSWQQPKTANGLDKLNKEEIKADKQIVYIDNRHNVFEGITGAEWTNIILWCKNYDNNLDGLQKVYTNGTDPEVKKLVWDLNEIEKPKQLTDAFKCVVDYGNFTSIQTITSSRRPYGLDADIGDKNDLSKVQINIDDISIYAKNKLIFYVAKDYPLPRKSIRFDKYKIFVAKAWGNMSDGYLGGAYSDIIIAPPNSVCTETYLESGCFDTYEQAKKHAKYLMTRFVRGLFYLNKFSQNSTRSWGAIPVQDYTESWWNKTIKEIDDELMKKYRIPDDVKNYIYTNIQEKTEANIINFKND